MKKLNVLYWVVTGLFAAFMLSTALPNLLSTKETIDFIAGGLGYPAYIIPFLGVAKLLGSIAILVPGYPKIKEWAYAGLFFDLIGATYSAVAVNGFEPSLLFMLLPFALAGLSYGFYNARLKAQA